MTKLNPTGSALVYSTYLGGSDDDQRLRHRGGRRRQRLRDGLDHVDRLPDRRAPSRPRSRRQSRRLRDEAQSPRAPPSSTPPTSAAAATIGPGIAVDATGNAYVTGQTLSTNFPTTAGAFQTTFAGNVDAFVAKLTEVAPPATLTLTPAAATNPVNTQHCVTATVNDVSGNPTPKVTVRFTVAGAVKTTGSATTNVNGQATFCYTGPALPGADAITAYADTNSNNTQEAGEPTGAATKTWGLPVTTPLCTITITNGGRITANNGDKASFGGNAKADAKGKTSGQEQYQDHGPAQKMNVHSINVLAVVCQGTTQASVYGRATINGSGSFFYRINVQDLGEPGVGKDTYGILLQNGYNSGEHKLEAGNVQIRRK